MRGKEENNGLYNVYFGYILANTFIYKKITYYFLLTCIRGV